MKITIPRCATWPPRFWDTTNPIRQAEAEAWVRSLITEDDETGPESPRSDAGATEAPRDHPNPETEHNGLSSWEYGLRRDGFVRIRDEGRWVWVHKDDLVKSMRQELAAALVAQEASQ